MVKARKPCSLGSVLTSAILEKSPCFSAPVLSFHEVTLVVAIPLSQAMIHLWGTLQIGTGLHELGEGRPGKDLVFLGAAEAHSS